MKEATGELNMTVITVIAIAAIGVFLFAFLPDILQSIKTNWDKTNCTTNPTTGVTTCP
jgi:uncharacterized membrane protein YedE/YeeE